MDTIQTDGKIIENMIRNYTNKNAQLDALLGFDIFHSTLLNQQHALGETKGGKMEEFMNTQETSSKINTSTIQNHGR